MLVFRHVIDSVVLIVLVMKLVSMITRNMEKLVLLLLEFKCILVQNHSKENLYTVDLNFSILFHLFKAVFILTKINERNSLTFLYHILLYKQYIVEPKCRTLETGGQGGSRQ